MDDLHPLAQVTNIVIAKGGMTYVTEYYPMWTASCMGSMRHA